MPKNNTDSNEYFEEIYSNTAKPWKKIIPVQLPYKYNLKRQNLGKVLEIGAGLGRNQGFLREAVGVEHNQFSVDYCRSKGFEVYLPKEFHSKFREYKYENAKFDSILMSHVLEHVEFENQVNILAEYLPYLKLNSKIMLITPQESGHKSTISHITWTDFNRISEILQESAPDYRIIKSFSFPLPRFAGKLFTYNEFNVIAERS